MEAHKKIFHSRPIFYCFLALMFAISTSKFVFQGNLNYIIFDAVLLLIFVLYCAFFKRIKLLLVILAVCLIGFGWFFVGTSTFSGKTFLGTQLIVGRISDDYQNSKNSASSTIVLKDVTIAGQRTGNIRLTVNFDEKNTLKVGDIVSFYGEVQNAKLFQFGNFQSFYYRDRTPYVCSIELSDVVVQGNKLSFDESFRLKIKDILYKNMGQENGSVAFAVLFGDKSGIDGDTYDAYQSAGIVHLLAVSGLHVGFLIALVGFFLKKLKVKRWLNFLISAVVLAVYAYLCNFSPSILRSGLMALIMFSCSISGKRYDSLSVLGLAGIIILFFMPLSALDVGFQMSFFCVLSIMILSPFFSKLLCKAFPKIVADGFSISFGIQIGILPFMASMMSTFNFLTFFVNFLVIPLFSVLYPVLVVSSLLVALLPFMGFLLTGCGYVFSLIKEIAVFFGQTSLKFTLEPLDIFFSAFLYLGIFFASRYCLASKKFKAILCSIFFSLSAVFFGLSFAQMPTSASISYCYYYTNSVVILHSKGGQSALVDLGSYDFCRKALNCLKIKNVDTAFVLQDTSYDIMVSRKLGIENVVRWGSGQGFEEETIVSLDETNLLGDFTFCYKSSGGKILGLEISFDDTSVFILKDKQIEENALDGVGCDIAFVGRQTDVAKAFDERCKVLGYQSGEFVDFNFIQNGNMSFNIENQKWRCLD